MKQPETFEQARAHALWCVAAYKGTPAISAVYLVPMPLSKGRTFWEEEWAWDGSALDVPTNAIKVYPLA